MAAKGTGLAMLIYFPLFALRAMGAGDAKLMAAVGSIVGPGNWLAIFFITAVLGGMVALIMILSRNRLSKTMGNIIFILREIAHLRPPYLHRRDLVAGNEEAMSLPHGSVITLAAMLFLMLITLYAPR
jgi:prepilin peptidase CpaA